VNQDQNRILQIDATIELRDYFRAYFDANKIKLIIACVICAVVIAGFTYFFILIGEQDILLKLSPLFFGFPLIAVIGQFLRIHASYRKYIADLSDSEKQIHYLFPESGDGFDLIRGKNFGHIAWESVRKVIERPEYFRFVLGKYESLIIPKRFILEKSDERLMREIIQSHLGDKAKMLMG
jgi:hypothetical protein